MTDAAAELRGWVVKRVLHGIVLLAVLLYSLIGYLLITDSAEAVPDALWLAAGAAAQAIYSFLSNSKSDKDEVTIRQPEGEPVPTTDVGAGELRLIGIVSMGVVVGLVLLHLLRQALPAG